MHLPRLLVRCQTSKRAYYVDIINLLKEEIRASSSKIGYMLILLAIQIYNLRQRKHCDILSHSMSTVGT